MKKFTRTYEETHTHTHILTHSHRDTDTHTHKATKRLKTFWLLRGKFSWPQFAKNNKVFFLVFHHPLKFGLYLREYICWLVIFAILENSFIFHFRAENSFTKKNTKKMFDQATTCFLRKKKKKKELSLFSQ